MKKKVAILYSGAKVWGGVETYLLNLISEAEDIEFYLLSMGEWELAEKLKEKPVTILKNKRTNFSLPSQIN